MEFHQQIDVIVNKFDFQALVSYVQLMSQAPFNKSTPRSMGTAEEARKLAKSMLESVSQSKTDTIMYQDGLEAEKIKSYLELRFVPLRSNVLDKVHE